jgi:dTDP-4-amino-4,6-dideoxygalactose transaminase
MTEYSAPTQFIDLAQQQESIRPSIDKAIQKVLDHGQYIMGPEVKELESQLQNFTGASNVLSCANGTDALTLVLMAWDIGPGNAVFVPSFTYVATAEAPAQLGATPFFVDVIEDTFNIDPESFKQAIIECKKIGLKPSAVIPVDLFGQPADIDSIELIARSEGIKILIDGAQSFGGSTKNRKVGTMGDATTTSFFPAKPLGCYGDGGAIFTNNEEYASRINSIRLHGRGNQKYDNVRIGINSRLDTIQAAILIEKLKIFPNELDSRAKVANLYSELLSDVCSVPVLTEGSKSAWAQYTLKFEDRSKIQKKNFKRRTYQVLYITQYPYLTNLDISTTHQYQLA